MAVPIGYIIGNFISSRMSRRASRRRMIWIGGLPGGGWVRRCWSSCRSAGLDSPYTLILPLAFYSCGSGFLVPNSLAGALTAVEPAAAGSAAALGGIPPDGRRVRQHRRHGLSGPDILPAGGPGDVLVLPSCPCWSSCCWWCHAQARSYGLNALSLRARHHREPPRRSPRARPWRRSDPVRPCLTRSRSRRRNIRR